MKIGARNRLKDRIVDVKEGASPAPRRNISPNSSKNEIERWATPIKASGVTVD